jgi:nucleotide-binding universal stress UspA family protein
MFKRILVATDASEYSIRALSTAVELAKKLNSDIELLHVIPQPLDYVADYLMGYDFAFTEEQIFEIGQTLMDITIKGIDVDQVHINKKIAVGNPSTVIIEEMRRDFDLLVMGTRGQGPTEGAVPGSVTRNVLAGAICPMLIVR